MKVSVTFDESYDRILHPDINPENSIAQVILRRNPFSFRKKILFWTWGSIIFFIESIHWAL